MSQTTLCRNFSGKEGGGGVLSKGRISGTLRYNVKLCLAYLKQCSTFMRNRLLIGIGLERLPAVLAFDEAVHVKAIKELIKHAYKLGCLLGILSSCHL